MADFHHPIAAFTFGFIHRIISLSQHFIHIQTGLQLLTMQANTHRENRVVRRKGRVYVSYRWRHEFPGHEYDR